jgi:hypothetical protein
MISKFPYGHVFWELPEKMFEYKEEQLQSWGKFELLRMHYYLTKRLDGYGHLTADNSIKNNCELFRRILAERNINGVTN